MSKTPTAEALAHYRAMLLTNPESYKAKLQQVREEFRSNAEAVFIQRDLDEADEEMSELEKNLALEQSDKMIRRLGVRIETIDDALTEFEESQSNLMTLNRKQRRIVGKQLREKRSNTLKTLQGPPPAVDDSRGEENDAGSGEQE